MPWELLLSGFSGPSFPASLEMGWQQGQIRDVLGERLEPLAEQLLTTLPWAQLQAWGQHSFPQVYPIACKKLSNIS